MVRTCGRDDSAGRTLLPGRSGRKSASAREGLARASARIAGLALALGLAGCGGVADGASDRAELSVAEVEAAIRQYDEAWRAKDTAAVARLLADDYTYLSSTGGVRSREWMLNDLLGHPEYRLDHSERTELRVAVHGATAVASSRWRGEGSYRGRSVRDDQRCSQVVVRKGLELQLVVEHCTAIAT